MHAELPVRLREELLAIATEAPLLLIDATGMNGTRYLLRPGTWRCHNEVCAAASHGSELTESFTEDETTVRFQFLLQARP